VNDGFSAQNVHASFPRLVPLGFDKTNDFGDPTMAFIEQPGLVAHMYVRIKDLIARVRALETATAGAAH
jgi:hypothetical protein